MRQDGEWKLDYTQKYKNGDYEIKDFKLKCIKEGLRLISCFILNKIMKIKAI